METSMTHPLIIIGTGLAGWSTAREFRKLDSTTPVLLITADGGHFYAKPSLSNAFAQKRTPEQLVSTPAARMVETQNVSLLAHTRVQAIDPATQTITTSKGVFQYSQLVLATGAQPIRVPLAGDAADQVLSVNSLDDFSAFHTQLTGAGGLQNSSESSPASDARKHVLIMGAGLIGCEFANDLAASGYQVTVVDPSDGPIAALLPAEAGAQLREALTRLGVTWHFGATVKSVNRTPGGGLLSSTLQVELSNGQVALVDIVLSAIGLRANTVLAQAAGLACERGVVVDTVLQTSAPKIYALGDSAQYASAGSRTLPYVMPIMSAARALAATLAGTRTEVVFPLMPVGIKTPALPIVVAAPAPGTPGEWRSAAPAVAGEMAESGIWHFMGLKGQHLGFVLSGKQTARRAEQAKLVVA
jgi:rubredoxin---NAD+ reductase